MKSTFAIAAVVGTASANPQQLNKMANNPGFQGFMSQNNKHYTTVGEMRLRAQIYSENDDEIRRLNAKSAASGKPNAARFGHNNFSDMTAQEFQATHLGLKNKDPALAVTNMPQHGWGGGRNNMMSQGRGRGLVADATTVDHVKDGFMGPVKQQGNCGSCWAFAANSALEGTIAKKNNTSPVRLSEQ
jgi:C1A family cysteine protease